MKWEYLISIILLLILIAIAAPAAVREFNNIYQGAFFKSEWTSLSQAEQSQIEIQFDNFAKNIRLCKDNPKQKCLCRNAILNFPDEITLKIIPVLGKDDKLLLIYGNKEIKNEIISDIFIVGMSFSQGIEESKTPYENVITFKNGEKYFNGDKIISSGIYKISTIRIGIITDDKASEEKQASLISGLQEC